MNETYLIMAKTVEEAIAIANREYAKDGKEVTYEILEMPKKGFLGIGARDAKIKITVSESESSKIGSELSSLVADLRGMKVHTNRGGSEGEDKPKKQQNPNQKKPQNGQAQQGQKKPAEKQASSEAKQPKPQGQQAPKQAQKPAQPKQEAKPKTEGQPKSEAKPAQPKQDKPQEAKKPQENKPKADAQPKQAKTEKQDKPAEKPQEPKSEPKKQNEPKQERQPKPEKTAEPKKEKPQEPKQAEPVTAEPVVTVTEAPAETAAEPAKTEYKSSLRNQAKPQRRQNRPKSQNADAVPGAEAIISAPMGLADFTREEGNESFGAANEGTSGGRMSNDIRKKPRHPKTAIKPEQIAENIKEAKEYKDIRPEIEEAVLPALHEDENVVDALELLEAALPAAEENEAELSGAESEASEAPAVEEDRQKVGVTEAEMQYALDFTNTLLKNMAIGATASRVECPEGEEYIIEGDANVYPKINIDGDGTGILIGHHGETLDAVQYLVNLAALRQSKQKGGDYVKIVVDIENYRAKREETLRSLARRMAARAVKYKRNVFLEPMNAYERRIIHSELHSFENVSTHSVGADKNRKIIITYEGPDKAAVPPRKEKEERTDKAERGEKREGKQESRGGSASRRSENRRPKKIQKRPIEKLPDFLASGTIEEGDRFVEIED